MRYVAIICAVILLVSCSVKKRTYRDGYYVDWAFHKRTSALAKKAEAPKASEIKENIPVEIVTAKTSKEFDAEQVSPNKKVVLLPDTCGDIITFSSGDNVTARVVEITQDKIKYKRCDNLEGPTFVVNKSTVSKIRYANGVEEKIEAPAASTSTASSGFSTYEKNHTKFEGPKKLNPKAIIALVLLPFGIFFGLTAIGSVFLCNAAIKEIKARPDYFKGRRLAKIVRGIAFGMIAYWVTVLVIALLIVLVLGL